MECSSSRRAWRPSVTAALLLVTALRLTAAEPPAAPPASQATTRTTTAPSAPLADLIAVNHGIRAYMAGDLDEARRQFESILARNPDHAAALYYLGLIYLSDGLAKAQAADTADEAIRLFDLARQNLQRVTQQADPTVTPVEAALLLGVSQLAADKPVEAGQPVELAIQAEETLRAYVEQTDAGRDDRYGFFYLGVADYRLGDHNAKSGHWEKANGYFQKAIAAFDSAARIAGVDRARYDEQPTARHALSEEHYQQFQHVVSYYRGLVALQQADNREARRLLEYVRDNDTTRLREHAAGILEKLDEIESQAPRPPSFETPIGRLDIQGELSIGTGYDTNVILLGKNTLLPLDVSHKWDWTLNTHAGVSVSRYFGARELPLGESLSVGVGGATTHAWHPSVHEFNLNQYAGRAWVNWQPLTDLYVGVEYEYTYTLLGAAPFISGNRITPVISRIWRRGGGAAADETGRTDLWYNYEYRDYLEDIGDWRLNRDGEYESVGIRHTFNLLRATDLWPSYFAAHEDETRALGNEWLQASVGYVFRDERTRGTEFDLAGHSILAGVAVPLPWRMAFTLDSVFTWEDYAAPSLFDYRRNERSDFVQTYDFGLTRWFVARGEDRDLPSLEVKLRAGVSLTYEDSNTWDRLHERVYEYNRAIFGLRLSVSF